MMTYLPPINKFVPPLDDPGQLFDIPKDDIQSCLSQILSASVYIRKKNYFLKKESRKRRIHSVLARANRLAVEYSNIVHDAALHMDLDQLWDMIENFLRLRISKLLLSSVTSYNGFIFKKNTGVLDVEQGDFDGRDHSSHNGPDHLDDESCDLDDGDGDGDDDELESPEMNEKDGDSPIPFSFDDMEKFVSENMQINADNEEGLDFFDSLGEESDSSVAAKDMKYSDFFKNIVDPAKANKNGDKPRYFETNEFKERDLVAPKHWSMRGEARAKERPENSLLELDLEFLYNHKNSANGDATNLSQDGATDALPLEMIIKQRIESNVFDNVEPKNFSIDKIRVERNVDAKDDVELNFSKSERGLADLYAEKYRKEVERITSGEQSELPKDKVEIADLFSKIIYKLDCLSNLNFLPSRPINIAAKTGDDIVPVIVSKTTNVYINRERLKRKSEMTREEKRSLRRLNKERYKKKAIKEDAKGGSNDGESDKLSKKIDKAASANHVKKRLGKLNTSELLQQKVSAGRGKKN